MKKTKTGLHIQTRKNRIEVLTEKGVDQDLLSRLKNVFSECDMARYAPSELDSSRMQNALREVKEIIDYLERYKG